MAFDRLKLSEIGEQHLQRLVNDKVQEGDTLEYKVAMYGGNDRAKKEMLIDISSMANHRGGYLIVGIKADKGGIAADVPGIEPGAHGERIRSICLDSIDRRIDGLEIEDIRLASGRSVVVISVPESMNAPHMVTFRGLNQFWKRHGKQKAKMTIDEIQEQFERRRKGQTVALGKKVLTQFEEVLVSMVINFCILVKAPRNLMVRLHPAMFGLPDKPLVERLPRDIEQDARNWFVSLWSEQEKWCVDLEPKDWQIVIMNISGLNWRLGYFREQLLPISVLLDGVPALSFKLVELLDRLTVTPSVSQPLAQDIRPFMLHEVSAIGQGLLDLLADTRRLLEELR